MEDIVYYYFNLPIMAKYAPDILRGLLITLQMAAIIVAAGLSLGLVLSMVRALGFRPVNVLLVVFVDIFRAVPQLVIIIFAYFALPYVGVRFSSFTAATLSLTLVLAAFAEEIFWAGFTSVDRGQWEASRSTGLGFMQSLRYVILPQAVRLAIPPLTNRTIAITKGTSLGSVIAVQEILNAAQSAQSQAANPSPLMLGALLYIVIFAPFVVFTRWLERRFAVWAK